MLHAWTSDSLRKDEQMMVWIIVIILALLWFFLPLMIFTNIIKIALGIKDDD